MSSAGTAFGKYFLLKKIAAGGMGEIFLAKLKGPVGFEKLLVIKRILSHQLENEEFLDMFFAEARVAAQLTHSNIVQIYEMGEIDDAYFIAMEYVHGKSLRDLIDRARQLGEYIHPGHCVDIISRLCAGISYAHNARDMSGQPLGIIHRDINPHNMLISYGGDLKVIDFGIAKSEMSMHHTETGTIKGKFVYMSPEQSAAEKLDKRSDLFAVGICLYETLTFVNPFAKANVVLSLDAIQRKDPAPVSETSPKLAPFDAIVRKALAKKPEDRYQDGMELRDDLQMLIQKGEIARPPQALADYMHVLFEEQIEQEKRMIIDTDSANTSQIEAMRKARIVDAHGRSGKMRTMQGKALTDSPVREDVAAHAANVDVVEDRPHSRVPFLMLLTAITAATLVASAGLVRFAPHPGANEALAMQPVGGQPGVLDPPEVEGVEGQEATADPGPEAVDRKEATAKAGKPVKVDPRAKAKAEREAREKARLQALKDIKEKSAASTGRDKPDDRGGSADSDSDSDGDSSPPPPPVAPSSPEPGFGVISVSSNPPVKITHRGTPGQTFKLKSPTGIIVFGAPGEEGKFHVKVTYRINGTQISFTSLTAEPWAIVRGKGGIGLGRTPLANVEGETSTLFELMNPKDGLRQRITVRYSPP